MPLHVWCDMQFNSGSLGLPSLLYCLSHTSLTTLCLSKWRAKKVCWCSRAPSQLTPPFTAQRPIQVVSYRVHNTAYWNLKLGIIPALVLLNDLWIIHYICSCRPILKYSHRTSTPGLHVSSPFPLTTCSGIDSNCRACFSSPQSVPQILDGFKHNPTTFSCSRRGSLDSCSRLGVALPPLKPPLVQIDDPFGELHALGHSVTKYPPKVSDRRNG